jgi:transposase-like protein
LNGGKFAKIAKWRRHTAEFKRQVVERMKTCENIHGLARELKVERKLLYTWARRGTDSGDQAPYMPDARKIRRNLQPRALPQ